MRLHHLIEARQGIAAPAYGRRSAAGRLPKKVEPIGGKVRIVAPTDRRAIRTVITGTKAISTAVYISAKNWMSFGLEGETEQLGAMRDEVMVGTNRLRVQPFRVELITSAGIIRHIPDAARQLSDGRWQIVDYKREWWQFRTAEGERQTLLGRMAADALGADYVRTVKEGLGSSTFTDNVQLVQLYRFVNASPRHRHIAAARLEQEAPIPLGRLADALDSARVNGFALVCSLMVRRQLEIDLSRKITRDSLVIKVASSPAVLPDLFWALRMHASLTL
jgi:hypothetical protein